MDSIALCLKLRSVIKPEDVSTNRNKNGNTSQSSERYATSLGCEHHSVKQEGWTTLLLAAHHKSDSSSVYSSLIRENADINSITPSESMNWSQMTALLYSKRLLFLRQSTGLLKSGTKFLTRSTSCKAAVEPQQQQHCFKRIFYHRDN